MVVYIHQQMSYSILDGFWILIVQWKLFRGIPLNQEKIKNEAFWWNTDDWFNLIQLPMNGTVICFRFSFVRDGSYDFRFKAEKKKEKKNGKFVSIEHLFLFPFNGFFSTSVINIISHRREILSFHCSSNISVKFSFYCVLRYENKAHENKKTTHNLLTKKPCTFFVHEYNGVFRCFFFLLEI